MKMNFVEVEEPVKCPKCGFFATLYVDINNKISIFRCARHHETKSKTNKKEMTLAMKTMASEITDDKLRAYANLMLSIDEDDE